MIINVLPVPGGPTSNTPEGSLAPTFVNLSGACNISHTSLTSNLALSCPATSSKLSLPEVNEYVLSQTNILMSRYQFTLALKDLY
jgi:hypothetical protein